MYYAASNYHADSTSVGFANTWYVQVFETKSARDEYVACATDLATRAISKQEIRKYTSKAPRPFSGQFFGIAAPDNPEDTTAGLLGYVDVMTDDDNFRLILRLNG